MGASVGREESAICVAAKAKAARSAQVERRVGERWGHGIVLYEVRVEVRERAVGCAGELSSEGRSVVEIRA